MDVNRDGHLDLISGSYSRTEPDTSMAGLLYVLLGDGDGGFQKPTVLCGSDGEPLIVPADEAVESPIVTVTTVYPGAEPSRVETGVTEVLEAALHAIEGIAEISAESTEGRSFIHLQFAQGHEPDQVAQLVRERVTGVLAKLPADVESPVVHSPDNSFDPDLRRICTRPFAADLDADGELDLLVGNFEGTFAWFRGEGPGRFAPVPTLLNAGERPLQIGAHSDPFLVDWDGDGDLDLIAGKSGGGVFRCENLGTAKSPAFSMPIELIAPNESPADEASFVTERDLRGPANSTRVWVTDVDSDGKLDLLVGDTVTLRSPAAGVEPKDALARLAAWTAEFEKLSAEFDHAAELDKADAVALGKRYAAHYQQRAAFLLEERTGYVWLFRQL